MHFQVPQFIETEDKIVGPFTLRQFIYIGSAALLVFFLYFTVAQWLWLALSAVIIGLGVSLALVKINGRPLPATILSLSSFLWQPQEYVWQPESTAMRKNATALKSIFGEGTIRKVVYGLALRGAWEQVQTGGRGASEGKEPQTFQERYQLVQRVTGERRAARRVDYS
jgi:hypothetical protein